MWKSFLKTLVVFLCISVIIGIYCIITGDFNVIQLKILSTSLIVSGYSLGGLCCSSIYNNHRLRNLSIIGVSINILTCLIILINLWLEINLNLKVSTSLLMLSIAISHICLISLVNNENNYVSTFKILTIVSNLLLLAICYYGIWIDANFVVESWKTIVISLLVCALGTIATPILNLVYKNSRIIVDKTEPKNSPVAYSVDKNIQDKIIGFVILGFEKIKSKVSCILKLSENELNIISSYEGNIVLEKIQFKDLVEAKLSSSIPFGENNESNEERINFINLIKELNMLDNVENLPGNINGNIYFQLAIKFKKIIDGKEVELQLIIRCNSDIADFASALESKIS